jgi:hypothetical protein
LPGGRNFSCTFVLQNCDMAHGNLIEWQRRSMFATSQLCQIVICMWQYAFSSLSGCASKPKGFTEHKDLRWFWFQMMHGGYPPGITERTLKKMGAISKTECLHRGGKIHLETCPPIRPNCFWSSSLWTCQAHGEISGCVLEGTLLKPIIKVKLFRICFQKLANVGLFSQNEKSFTWIKIGFPSPKFGKIWGMQNWITCCNLEVL